MKMRKIIALALSVTVIAGLAGCGGAPKSAVEKAEKESKETTSEESTDGKKVIRIAHGQPEDHPEHLGLLEFEKYIEENLGDKYEVEIYPNELMGGSAQALELMQSGSLEMVVSSTSNLEAFTDTYKIFGLPYLFDDAESFFKVMDNEEFTDKIYESTIDQGIQGVSWFFAGTRSFYSPDKIASPEDMKGKKVRIQSSDTNVKMVEALGGAATVLAYSEVYTALQNGVIDAAESPEMALVSHKHGEVAKFYSYDEHQIMPDMLVANPDFMKSISEEDLSVFEEAFKKCSEFEREEWQNETEDIIAQAKEMGVEFVDVDKEAFKSLLLPVADEVLNEIPDLKPLYDEVKEIQAS